MGQKDLEELLDRYLNGKTSPEETERVETWIRDGEVPGNEWFSLDQAGKDRWLSAVFSQIQAHIGVTEDTHTTMSPGAGESKLVVMNPRKYLWKIAAVAAVLIVAIALYVERAALQSPLHPVTLASLSVPVHQKQQIILSDGSKIWVNEGSELRYPKVFTGNAREVYLSGEAYFDIGHDVSRPFIIHTGNVITTVLGTAFNIKEDKAGRTVVVTVTNGKVSVTGGGRLLGIITPNQQISFDQANDSYSRQSVDAREVASWQEDGELHFEDITMEEAVKKLEARFHVKIDFGNSRIANCRFTGTALTGEGLDKILNVVCAFNNATYRKNTDGSILIDGPGCD